ncbi:MAG: RNA polymerase sigma factor [Isosphaerales bacterium]
MTSITAAQRAKPRETATQDSLRSLVEELLWGVRDPDRFQTACDQVVRSIQRILIARCGDGRLAEDAAVSVFGTFFRRISAGELSIENVSTIEQFLVQAAFAKAKALRGCPMLPLTADSADPSPPVDRAFTAVEDEAQDRERTRVMRRFLDDVFKRIEPYFKNRKHRAIFECLLQSRYGGTKLTQPEVASTVGCSERTVQRVQKAFQEHWLPLIERSQREFRELVSRLEGLDS